MRPKQAITSSWRPLGWHGWLLQIKLQTTLMSAVFAHLCQPQPYLLREGGEALRTPLTAVTQKHTRSCIVGQRLCWCSWCFALSRLTFVFVHVLCKIQREKARGGDQPRRVRHVEEVFQDTPRAHHLVQEERTKDGQHFEQRWTKGARCVLCILSAKKFNGWMNPTSVIL